METLKIAASFSLKAYNAGLFLSRGRDMHPHRTIDSYELIFVDRGILGMYEEDNRFEIKAGESLLLFPGRKHGGTFRYSNELRFYWIHFSLSGRAEDDQTISVPQHVRVKQAERLAELYRYFLDDQENGYANTPGADLICMMMLDEVSRSKQTGKSAPHPSHIASLASMYIKTHSHENISTLDIANALGRNPDYLGRVFKSVYNETIIDTIHKEQIRNARKLLLSSQYNIDKIAEMTGFSDTGYFRRIFKKIQGMSPGKYRTIYAQVHLNTE